MTKYKDGVNNDNNDNRTNDTTMFSNWRGCKASSFADPADVARYHKMILDGHSEQYALTKGDNGIGFTGLDTTVLQVPYVALPYEDWFYVWGMKSNAVGRPVEVLINNKLVVCILGDTMPHEKAITNGCGIDLAPGAQWQFGLRAPFIVEAKWHWLDLPRAAMFRIQVAPGAIEDQSAW